MRTVIQRVKEAKILVNGECVSEIGVGILVLLGAESGDTGKEADYLAHKIVNFRIFRDENDRMNMSVKDVGGEVLVVSQITLASHVKKGLRPDFSGAIDEDSAKTLYERFVQNVREEGVSVKTGVFKAHMEVHMINDGPVTFIIERNPK